MVARIPLADSVTRQKRNTGQVDTPEILWVFFRGASKKYEHDKVDELVSVANLEFESWGGPSRLLNCLTSKPDFRKLNAAMVTGRPERLRD